MTNNDLQTLAMLINQERDKILAEWRTHVRQLPSAQHLDTPTLNDHIPRLLEELATALSTRAIESIPEALAEGSSPAHGSQRVQDGFDIEEVVAEYNILRGCIHDLAEQNALPLRGKSFHIVNRVLDGAIGLAVQNYATQKAREVQQRRHEYLAFVAHDLRTPLNAIAMAAKVLELSVPTSGENSPTAQMLKTLRRNVQHLTELVAKVIEENTQLRSEAGIQIERRTFELWPQVELLLYDLQPVAGSDCTQLLNKVPHDLTVSADAGLLRRIFQNLIANAIKYTRQGQIIIEARELPDAQGVECWVSDNGAGIPPERLDKVFDALETDSEMPGGLGLGLAIVKTFVEAHDGKVSVTSTLGQGSTFHFTLPRKPTDPPCPNSR